MSKLDKALSRVRNLIERLRVPASAKSLPEPAGMFFWQQGLGGLHLSREEAKMYRECVDTLVDLHGPNHDLNPMSRVAAEKLLRAALLPPLRPGRGSKQPGRSTFVRRMSKSLGCRSLFAPSFHAVAA